jgi:hypothetical protein
MKAGFCAAKSRLGMGDVRDEADSEKRALALDCGERFASTQRAVQER